MIKNFKHKGLEQFYTTGKAKGIKPAHAKRLRLQLAALNAAGEIGDVDMPGWRLHPLTGNRKGKWAVVVSGNWRMVFEFKDGNAYVVDYEDYH